MTRIIYYVLAILSLAGCSSVKARLSPELTRHQARIAVIDFSAKGFSVGQSIGVMAADQFAHHLFLKQKADVIDRALVTSAAADAGILSAGAFSQAQVQQLAKRLNADVLILGEMQNILPATDRLFGQQAHCFVTVRFVDPASGSIAGVLSHEDQGSHGEIQLITKMVTELAGRMKKPDAEKTAEVDSTLQVVNRR
jgi:outer membrane murein-binding lipoprotein Lpp